MKILLLAAFLLAIVVFILQDRKNKREHEKELKSIQKRIAEIEDEETRGNHNE